MYIHSLTYIHTYTHRANIHSILHVPPAGARNRDARGSPDTRSTRTHEENEFASVNTNSESGRISADSTMTARDRDVFTGMSSHILSSLRSLHSSSRKDDLKQNGRGDAHTASTGPEASKDAIRKASFSSFRLRASSITSSAAFARSQQSSTPAEKGSPTQTVPATPLSKLRTLSLKSAVAKLTFASAATKKLSASALLFANKNGRNGRNSDGPTGEDDVRSSSVGRMFACVERHWACDVNSIRVSKFEACIHACARIHACMHICMHACVYSHIYGSVSVSMYVCVE